MNQITFHELESIFFIVLLCFSVFSLIPLGKISIHKNILDKNALWLVVHFLSSGLTAIVASDFAYEYFNGGRILLEMVIFLIIFVGMLTYFKIVKIGQND